MRSRSAGVSWVFVFVTFAAGLTVRFARLGLPFVVVKYGGSALWALMIYWVVAAVLPACGVATVALAAGFVTNAVELGKLYRSPGLEDFRHTLPGVLLLGRVFSVWNLAVYWVAIGVGAALERYMRRKSSAQ